MRVILLGRKPVACEALRYMRSCGTDVVAVSAATENRLDPYHERLADVAESLGIPVVQDEDLSGDQAARSVGRLDLGSIDLVVSMLHQRRISRSILDLGRLGCVNFHPAPLPEYRGWGTYNVAILENAQRWGAAAHLADHGFDTGPLIRSRHFEVDCSKETALSLQRRTQPVLLELFKEVFDAAVKDGVLRATPQGPGRSFTKKEVMARRFITSDDPPEVVERKVRAFWYPPNPCAELQIGGEYYPVITHAILQTLVPLLRDQK